MKVWVPDDALERLDDLPGEIELAIFPQDASSAPWVKEVEFFVPPYWLREEVREALPRMGALKVVQTTVAGVDWVLDAVPDRVTLCNARGVHDAPVSEWVVGAILALVKRFPEARDLQRQAQWEVPPIEDLQGKTALIVGYGSIGRAVAKRLQPFGIETLAVARRSREGVDTMEDLPGLLPRADIVVVLTPLTPETQGLVDAAFFDRMRDGALLVNAARGAIVETPALLDALESQRVRAALDVTDPEPLPADHPLWHAPGVFITPHIAGRVPRFQERAYRLVREQLLRHLEGQRLQNVVTEGY